MLTGGGDAHPGELAGLQILSVLDDHQPVGVILRSLSAVFDRERIGEDDRQQRIMLLLVRARKDYTVV